MTISELFLMLSDAFQLDSWTPSPRSKGRQFEKSCYSVWAVNELKLYITQELCPAKSASIREFIWIVMEFELMMRRYAKEHLAHNLMFKVAQDVSADVIDILHAMQ
jgi:hypothetical protein